MTRDPTAPVPGSSELPELAEVIARVSNWGRWGDDDQLGTVNYATDATRGAAARDVRSGRCVSLALPLDRDGPIPAFDTRFNPIHTMLETGTDYLAGRQTYAAEGWGYADDAISMPLQCSTQWDALSHVFHDGRMYNGHSAAAVTARGAERNDIAKLSSNLATRGVLADVPHALGVDWLGLAHRITVDELDYTLSVQRVEPRSGDVVLIRTGNMHRARREGSWNRYTHDDEPGLGLDAAIWLHEHEVAATASDTWSYEVLPSGTDLFLPLHVVAIVHMGLTIGEMFDLDELAQACRTAGKYDFLFVGPPLPFTHAVGSPANPLAIL